MTSPTTLSITPDIALAIYLACIDSEDASLELTVADATGRPMQVVIESGCHIHLPTTQAQAVLMDEEDA